MRVFLQLPLGKRFGVGQLLRFDFAHRVRIRELLGVPQRVAYRLFHRLRDAVALRHGLGVRVAQREH